MMGRDTDQPYATTPRVERDLGLSVEEQRQRGEGRAAACERGGQRLLIVEGRDCYLDAVGCLARVANDRAHGLLEPSLLPTRP